MLVLGIETTCDETGIAVVEDGRRVLVNQVLSQIPLHERFGGVVPEIASRAHVECITRVIERALREAGLAGEGRPWPPALDAIAVAHRPGLVGSLIVGVMAAKTLAWAWGLPLIGVDHIHAHIYAALMASGSEGLGETPAEEVFPAVSLVISGGHSALYLSESWTAHRLLGATTDDAVGEAFDKAASILGLGYPGGPAISRAAQEGRAGTVRFPRSLIDSDSLDFSFSGIKTAVLYHVKGQNARRDAPIRAEVSIPDVAASFEEAVVEVLIAKLRRAIEQEGVRSAIVGGGVAANRRLRERLDRLARKEDLRLLYPPAPLCTDNGAMIAGLGYRLLLEGRRDDLTLDADPVTAR